MTVGLSDCTPRYSCADLLLVLIYSYFILVGNTPMLSTFEPLRGDDPRAFDYLHVRPELLTDIIHRERKPLRRDATVSPDSHGYPISQQSERQQHVRAGGSSRVCGSGYQRSTQQSTRQHHTPARCAHSHALHGCQQVRFGRSRN